MKQFSPNDVQGLFFNCTYIDSANGVLFPSTTARSVDFVGTTQGSGTFSSISCLDGKFMTGVHWRYENAPEPRSFIAVRCSNLDGTNATHRFQTGAPTTLMPGYFSGNCGPNTVMRGVSFHMHETDGWIRKFLGYCW